MERMSRCIRLGAAIAALWFFSGTAFAHPVYIGPPKETITDQLSTSSVIVFARPDTQDPLRFHPAVWLKGDPDAALPAIPHLVDSDTRRMLARTGADAVLFVHRPDDRGWHRLTYCSEPVRQMLDDLVAEMPQWLEGRDDPRRFAFFAERYAHPDWTIRTLSLTELSQARYGQIRTLKPQLSRDQIVALLRNPMEFRFADLYIVMLGLIDSAEAADLVRNKIENVHRLNYSTDVTAWGTALVEIDGFAGVEQLAALILGDGYVPQKTALTALTALALHGTEGRVDLRDRIAEILGESAKIDAGFAANAVSTLVQWQDWRAAAAVKAHLSGSGQIGLQQRIVLTAYLAAAQQSARSPEGLEKSQE